MISLFLCKYTKKRKVSIFSYICPTFHTHITMNRLKYNISVRLILLFSLFFALYSCEKVSPKDVVIEEKEKTILVYMAADNDISVYAADNIRQILEGYVPDDNNLLIYSVNFDLTTREIKDTLPVLVKVYKDKSNNVAVDTLYRFPYQNSATKLAMSRVLNITKAICPAKSYGFVLWSHGTGWLPPGYFSSESLSTSETVELQSQIDRVKKYQIENYSHLPRFENKWEAAPGGIDPYSHLVKSFGSEREIELSIFDLADAIPQDMTFDFIAFDACLMGGIEIAYQLKDKCNYMIYSAAEILVASFDYSTVVKDMFEEDYNKVSYDIYKYYADRSGLYQSVTIATLKMSELEKVAESAREIFDNHRADIQTLDLSLIQPYFRYDKHWYFDLTDFIRNLGTPSEVSKFEDAMEKLVTAKYTTGQMIDLIIDPNKFSGVSTYINNPLNPELDAYYQRFEWEKAVHMISED